LGQLGGLTNEGLASITLLNLKRGLWCSKHLGVRHEALCQSGRSRYGGRDTGEVTSSSGEGISHKTRSNTHISKKMEVFEQDQQGRAKGCGKLSGAQIRHGRNGVAQVGSGLQTTKRDEERRRKKHFTAEGTKLGESRKNSLPFPKEKRVGMEGNGRKQKEPKRRGEKDGGKLKPETGTLQAGDRGKGGTSRVFNILNLFRVAKRGLKVSKRVKWAEYVPKEKENKSDKCKGEN